MIRFVLGVIIMIGALVFLGCPLRMVLRMSAGDLNAWVALIGLSLSSNWCICSETGIQPWKSTGNNKSKWSSSSGYRCWNLNSLTCTSLLKASRLVQSCTNHYVSCRRIDFRSYGSEIKNVLCRWNP